MQTASPILGCNYKSQQSNWATDIAYFKSIGLTGIRPNLDGISAGWAPPGPMSAGSYEYWRLCAKTFAAAGFWVSWGPSGPNGLSGQNLTLTMWNNYVTSVLADAAYMQSQGIVLAAYELGNELEGYCDPATFPASGFAAAMGSLATQVKAVYTLSPIAYSAWDFNGTTYNSWITTGLGGLDMIGVHPYSNINSGGRGLSLGGFRSIQNPTDSQIFYHFGPSKCYISEFGLDGGNTGDDNMPLMPVYLKTQMTRDRWAYIKNMGFTHAMIYSYVGYLNTDNQFAMLLMNGQDVPWWNPLVVNGKRTNAVNFN
jgi:hypothetical protein